VVGRVHRHARHRAVLVAPCEPEVEGTEDGRERDHEQAYERPSRGEEEDRKQQRERRDREHEPRRRDAEEPRLGPDDRDRHDLRVRRGELDALRVSFGFHAVSVPAPARRVTRTVSSAPMSSIDPRVDIGHVHLKVADLDRALDFYVGVLGFGLQQRIGDSAAFISAGDYHHHLGLNTWESKGGSPAPRGTTGLYHTAIRYPDRATLADALRRVLAAGVTLEGASDHGVSEAIYLRDPDGNGVELYRDRPRDEWPRPAEGKGVAMMTVPLDLQTLLAEAP